jgi:hypothetical protein
MTRPDSPCIAVCDVLYKDICSGCGRHYLEVARWTEMTSEEKEAVWLRIETDATSWRFNKYKDRVKNEHQENI